MIRIVSSTNRRAVDELLSSTRIRDRATERAAARIVDRVRRGGDGALKRYARNFDGLTGAIEAQGRVGLMLNVRRDHLDAILGQLPALQRPTVSSLSDPEWVAINTILEEKTARDLIPRLKQAGGQGIVEYPLNKIVV